MEGVLQIVVNWGRRQWKQRRISEDGFVERRKSSCREGCSLCRRRSRWRRKPSVAFRKAEVIPRMKSGAADTHLAEKTVSRNLSRVEEYIGENTK